MKQVKIRDKNYNCSNAIYYYIQGLESENRLFNMEIKGHEQSELELSKRISKAIEYIKNMPYLQEVDEEFENVDGEVYFTYKEWDDTELLTILKGVDKE